MILSNSQLDEDLLYFMGVLSNTAYSWALPAFDTLFNHGFRINELKSIGEWTVDNLGNVNAATSKGSNNRIIPITQFNEVLQSDIYNGSNNTFARSYDSFERLFQSKKPKKNYTVGAKSIGSHLFRHNYIKKLDNNGSTIQEIQQITGIVKPTIVEGYINSIIKFKEV